MWNHSDRLFSIHPNQFLNYYYHDGRKHKRNLYDLTTTSSSSFSSSSEEEENDNNDDNRKVTISQAFIQLQLSSPLRKHLLNELWKDSEYDIVDELSGNSNSNSSNSRSRKKQKERGKEDHYYHQMIFLEGMIGLGLLKYLQNAIVGITLENREVTGPNRESGQYIEESQLLFEWISSDNPLRHLMNQEKETSQGNQKLLSLRSHLLQSLYPFLLNDLFVYLRIGKSSTSHRYQVIPLSLLLQNTELMKLSMSYLILSKSLFRRKLLLTAEGLKLNNNHHREDGSIAGSSSSYFDSSSSPSSSSSSEGILMNLSLSDDIESTSLLELFLLSYESSVIKELFSLFHCLCEDKLFELSSLFSSSSTSSSSSSSSSSIGSIFSSLFSEKSCFLISLPSYFKGEHLLFYELCNHLLPEFQIKVKEWFESLQSLFINDNNGDNSNNDKKKRIENDLVSILLLPYLILQKYSQSVLNDLIFYKKSLNQIHEILNLQLIASKYVMIYILLMIRSLSSSSSNDTVENQHHQHHHHFHSQLASFLNIDIKEVQMIDCLRRIDFKEGNKEVMNQLTQKNEDHLRSSFPFDNSSLLFSSFGIQFLSNYSLIPTMIRRLLFTNQLTMLSSLLQSFLHNRHPIMSRKEGIVAFAFSLPFSLKETWELHWQQSKTYCDSLLSSSSSSSDSLEARQDITRFFCYWCLLMKSSDFHPFYSLLNKDLTNAVSFPLFFLVFLIFSLLLLRLLGIRGNY
jgi:hypothetical protein